MTLKPIHIIVVGAVGIAICVAVIVVGVVELAAADNEKKSHAYRCGYVRGMKFVADRANINIGPSPLRNCEQFNSLNEGKAS